ncbi:DEAD-box ATP-dependent RNA helicase 22 isoform X2 [Mangifera indica]|uniref:DEAD-box ATP-dependent RNA helicase 22 isoform X2 n=1 Tax=Mangifera indica TaxID=29780 RepID=UPI001CFB1697|nr:DEAD-box ATP-dependent RNA helicase 22 isoform X2 [Mangifera indica]
MLLYRTSSILHFYRLSSPSKLLSKFKTSSSFFSSSVPSSSYPLGVHFIFLNKSGGRHFKGFSTVATAVADKKGSSSTFFADDAVSWKSLGLSDRLSRAVENSGFGRPSIVQAASIAPILSGKDVVIAAETGSGKTHSYLVPLIDKLCAVLDGSKNTNSDEGLAPSHGLSLVLCPNVLLCEQVVQMANGLSGDDGEPLLKVAAICGRQGWPVDKPDIIVSTPAALLNNIDPKRHRRLDFIRGMKYVVFDEADMLLNGSFQNQVIRLINMLRFDEKQLSHMNKSGAEKLMGISNDSLSNSGLEDEHYIQNTDIVEREENSESDVDVEDLTEETKSGSIQNKDWRRVRKSYERSKQYIFVAATLPVNGKKTAGAVLKQMFPDAIWVSGNYLHCHNPRLKEKWVEVTVDTQVDALINAVKERFVCGTDISRTMVFANTVEAVEAVAKILETAEIECYRYHKDHSLEERTKNLVNFREKGGVFVCTDAAARGIDIPNVSHVIQADFATSAVDFLHRVGRTARAGQYGLVTSLYTESNRDLVDAIRLAGKLGQPVDTAFSRKRSFRNKLKKRGSSKVRGTSTVEMVTV